MRAFQLAADIAASSPEALSAVQKAGILHALVDDLSQSTDVLASINALELLGEVAKSAHGASFVVEGQLPRQLEKMIQGESTDSFARSRAMMVAAKLVSPEGGAPSPLNEQGRYFTAFGIVSGTRCRSTPAPLGLQSIDYSVLAWSCL
jgi:hypothetical protein